jgi:hypothetical protein
VVKSIISAIPNYGMCILKLPLGFLDHVDNSSRNFFWKGKDIEQKGKCLVKWYNVCKPKKAGGLGVLNLRTQNIALLLKFLFKFMNRQDIPWVQLIWQAHYSNGKFPKALMPVVLSGGKIVFPCLVLFSILLTVKLGMVILSQLSRAHKGRVSTQLSSSWSGHCGRSKTRGCSNATPKPCAHSVKESLTRLSSGSSQVL